MADLAMTLRRAAHDRGVVLFGLIISLVLCLPLLQRLSPPRTGYQAEYALFQTLQDTDERLAAGATIAPGVATPAPEDLQRELTLIERVTASIDDAASPVRITRQMYRLRAEMLRQADHGRDYQDFKHRPLATVLTLRQDVAVLAWLVRTDGRFYGQDEVRLPAGVQLARTLQRFVSSTFVLLLGAMLASYYLFRVKWLGQGDFFNLVPLGKGRQVAWQLLAAVLVTVVVVVGAMGLATLAALLLGGGDWSYPLAYSVDGQHVLLITCGRFVLSYLAFWLALMAVILTMTALVQQFTRHLATGLLAVIALCVMLQKAPAGSWFAFRYFDLAEVIAPAAGAAGRAPGLIGVAVMLGTAALIGAVALLVAQRRQRI